MTPGVRLQPHTGTRNTLPNTPPGAATAHHSDQTTPHKHQRSINRPPFQQPARCVLFRPTGMYLHNELRQLLTQHDRLADHA